MLVYDSPYKLGYQRGILIGNLHELELVTLTDITQGIHS